MFYKNLIIVGVRTGKLLVKCFLANVVMLKSSSIHYGTLNAESAKVTLIVMLQSKSLPSWSPLSPLVLEKWGLLAETQSSSYV